MRILRHACFPNFKNGRIFHDLKFVIPHDDGDGDDHGT